MLVWTYLPLRNWVSALCTLYRFQNHMRYRLQQVNIYQFQILWNFYGHSISGCSMHAIFYIEIWMYGVNPYLNKHDILWLAAQVSKESRVLEWVAIRERGRQGYGACWSSQQLMPLKSWDSTGIQDEGAVVPCLFPAPRLELVRHTD